MKGEYIPQELNICVSVLIFGFKCEIKEIDFDITTACSTQLSMKFFLRIIVIMSTIVGILTFLSRKNSILGLSEPELKLGFFYIFYTYEHSKFH